MIISKCKNLTKCYGVEWYLIGVVKSEKINALERKLVVEKQPRKKIEYFEMIRKLEEELS